MIGRLVGAALCGFIGAVWFGQGIGKIHGSFMTGETQWTVIGLGMMALAVGLVISVVVTSRRRREDPTL